MQTMDIETRSWNESDNWSECSPNEWVRGLEVMFSHPMLFPYHICGYSVGAGFSTGPNSGVNSALGDGKSNVHPSPSKAVPTPIEIGFVLLQRLRSKEHEADNLSDILSMGTDAMTGHSDRPTQSQQSLQNDGSFEYDAYFVMEGVKHARGGKASLRFKGNPKTQKSRKKEKKRSGRRESARATRRLPRSTRNVY